jgi:hypothetical protein
VPVNVEKNIDQGFHDFHAVYYTDRPWESIIKDMLQGYGIRGLGIREDEEMGEDRI